MTKKLEERTIHFLKIVEKHNLCFKRLKYNFNMEEILILEVIVRRGQVQIETDKVKVVKEQKTSIKLKEVESFLGFANFSTDNLSRTSVIWQNLSMNSKEKKIRNGKNNNRKHLKN